MIARIRKRKGRGRVISTLTCCMLAAGGLSWLSGHEAMAEEGDKTIKAPQQYFVQLLGTRDGRPENMTPEEQQVMSEHYQYLKELVRQKKVYLAGPVFSPVFGLIILSADSEEEARTIMNNEPSVKAGVHTYTMQPMRVSLVVDFMSPERHVPDPSDRILRKEVVVPATLDEVWAAWTTTEGVTSFFSSHASVDLRIGGPFEIYFLLDEPYGSRGSEDCKILSYLPREMLSFEWNAPPSFGELRGMHTRVILEFEEAGAGRVRVRLSHVGWGKGAEWDRLFEYFDRAWSEVLGNFQKRFEEGPIDWSEP